MLLTRWEPFREMERLQGAINRLFDGSPANRWSPPFSRFSFLPGQSARSYPLLNLREDADAYRVEALAPGIEPGSLKISVVNRQLTIEGEKQAAAGEIKSEAYHRCERSAGRFVRALTLPVEIDADLVSAEYRDGLLSVTLPKAESARPRQIAVKVN